MAAREISVELILNRRVYALNGRNIGRIEEVRVENRRGECVVTEYLVGVYALFERLAAYSIGRSILRTLRLSRRGEGYRIAWNQLDLSDPEKPRLKCAVGDLQSLDEDA
jgi:sporulation protein YlmC with PRC-barrel domain